jgi:hypothetical protein
MASGTLAEGEELLSNILRAARRMPAQRIAQLRRIPSKARLSSRLGFLNRSAVLPSVQNFSYTFPSLRLAYEFSDLLGGLTVALGGLRPTVTCIWSLTALLGVLTFAQQSEAACYRLLKPNGWQYETVCNNSGGGGSSGGGYNYGAAAAAGIAVLGVLIDSVEQHRQAEQHNNNNRAIAEENARRAARAAMCRRNHQLADEANKEGNEVLDRWDPGGAIPYYERAIALLSACGDRGNQAIIRGNLDQARKQYAAVRPDNRVDDAQSRYAKQNIYSAPNPFAAPRNASGSSSAAVPRDEQYCTSAGPYERNTASWFNNCVWDGTKQSVRYQPKIDPRELKRRASEQCRNAPQENVRQCSIVAEVRILMTEDPDIRRRCAGAAHKLVECVDAAYVYGPDGKHEALRAMLLSGIDQMPGGKNVVPQDVVRGCNNGSPGATCRPYGSAQGTAANPDLPASPQRTDDQSLIEAGRADYQNRLFDRVAAASAHAAAQMIESNMSAEDRRTCVTTAYNTIRAHLTGGNPPVPVQCAAIADIARSRLAYYAAARIDIGPTEADDPLKDYLNSRNRHSGGRNSGELGPNVLQLTPDEKLNKQVECMLARRDNC